MSDVQCRPGLTATLFPVWRRGLGCCLASVLWICFASPVVAERPAAPEQAELYLDEYAKFLARLHEASFVYKGHLTRSTSTEGLCAKADSEGTVSLSASRKAVHYSQSLTLTWSNEAVPVPLDQGSVEFLGTPDGLLTVAGFKQREAGKPQFSVRWQRQAPANDWPYELRRDHLGLFLGYSLAGGQKNEGRAAERQSLLEIARAGRPEFVRDRGIDSAELVGFAAKTSECEVRALFEAADVHLLRQVEWSRPAGKVEPFGMSKATLTILDAKSNDQTPISMKLRIKLEVAGGKIDRATLPKGAVVARGPKTPTDAPLPPQSYETEYEIIDIRVQEKPDAPWFQLARVIPDGTNVFVTGKENFPHYWQAGKVREGIPPANDNEIREQIQTAFDRPQSPVTRYQNAHAGTRLSHQRCLVVFADPEQPSTRSLYEGCLAHRAFQGILSNYRTLAVSTSKKDRALADELAKSIGVDRGDDATPLLAITDENRKLLGVLSGRGLLAASGITVDASRLNAFLKRHSPPPIDAQKLWAGALDQARRDNKRVLLQQTATWCGPCWLLTQFLDEQRSVWEMDYVWIKVDERWLHADKVMQRIRKDDSGGIPWMAVLDAEGKTLATSDTPGGENIGFPSAEEPEAIEHFMNMLKTTAQRMTAADLETLRNALKKE